MSLLWTPSPNGRSMPLREANLNTVMGMGTSFLGIYFSGGINSAMEPDSSQKSVPSHGNEDFLSLVISIWMTREGTERTRVHCPSPSAYVGNIRLYFL